MGDSFTVKLDVSAITHDENERLYILLVDPARMKMIYQFKLWVRFLFSVESQIKFLYEGAAIHDLEDINILKLLKIVHIERTDHAVGEREQQEQLIAKLNRYDEWCGNTTPAETPQNLCRLMNGDGFQSSNREHNAKESKTEGSELNFSITNEQCDRQEIHRREQKNNFSDTQGSLNKKNEICDKSENTNCSLVSPPGSIPSDEVEISSENYYRKYNNTPKCAGKSEKSCSEVVKQQSSAKRKSAHKPFSLYHFLHTLRCQESNVDDNKVKHDPAMELDEKEVAGMKSNGEMFNNNDEKDELLIKRKRKRIRKHKNQKNKVNLPVEMYKDTMVPLFHYKENFKSKSLSPQAKHIRFNTDDDDNKEEATKPVKDELPAVHENSSGTLLNSGSEIRNDNRFVEVTSDDFVNESDTALMATSDVNTTVQENGNGESEAKNVSVTDCVEVNNGSLSDSSGNVSDILGSLRKKRKAPFVFDRFATCV